MKDSQTLDLLLGSGYAQGYNGTRSELSNLNCALWYESCRVEAPVYQRVTSHCSLQAYMWRDCGAQAECMPDCVPLSLHVACLYTNTHLHVTYALSSHQRRRRRASLLCFQGARLKVELMGWGCSWVHVGGKWHRQAAQCRLMAVWSLKIHRSWWI